MLFLGALSLTASALIAPAFLREVKPPVLVFMDQLFASPILFLLMTIDYHSTQCRPLRLFNFTAGDVVCNSVPSSSPLPSSQLTNESSATLCYAYGLEWSYFAAVSVEGWAVAMVIGVLNCVVAGLTYYILIFSIGETLRYSFRFFKTKKVIKYFCHEHPLSN